MTAVQTQRRNMNHLTATVWELQDFSARTMVPDFEWDLAEDIARWGWSDAHPIDLIVRPGGVTRLLDGNKRVRYLADKGYLSVVVPLKIKIDTLKCRGENPFVIQTQPIAQESST